MKKIILTSLLLLFTVIVYSQNQKRIIFNYQSGIDSTIEKKGEYIYKLANEHSFRYVAEKNKKKEVNYSSIKGDITSYDAFIKSNKGKSYPEFFSEYSFYIYIKDTELKGCLIEVEKIWLVEDKISD